MVPRFSSGTWFGPRKQATAMVNIFEPHFCRCRTCFRTGFGFTSENPAGMPAGVFRPLDAEGRAVRCSKMFVAKKKYRCFGIWLQNDIKYQLEYYIYIYVTITKTYPYTWVFLWCGISTTWSTIVAFGTAKCAWYTTKRFVAFMGVKLCIVGSECT